MSNDFLQIRNIIAKKQPYLSRDAGYLDSQWKSLPDLNNNQYQSNSISINTQTLLQVYVAPSDLKFAMPINVVSSGTPYTAATKIAYKSSALNLIHTVTLATMSNQTIFTQSFNSIANNFRLMTEHDKQYLETNGARLGYAKDTCAGDLASVGVPTVQNDSLNTSPTYNEGFAKRVKLFKQSCEFGTRVANGFSTVVTFDLPDLADYFRQANMPFINEAYILTIKTSFYGNNQLCPFVFDKADGAAAPIITIGPAAFPGTNDVISGCRLYYRTVEPSVNVKETIMNSLSSADGLKRSIYHRVYDLIEPNTPGLDLGVGAANISKQINSALVLPTRVFVFTPRTTSLTTHGSGTVTGLFNSVAQLTNCNLYVSNIKIYQEDLMNTEDQWRIFKDQLPPQGADLTYQDFVTSYRVICFDLTKSSTKLVSGGGAVTSMRFVATKVDSVPCDIYILVERQQLVDISLASGQTTSVIG